MPFTNGGENDIAVFRMRFFKVSHSYVVSSFYFLFLKIFLKVSENFSSIDLKREEHVYIYILYLHTESVISKVFCISARVPLN